MGIWLKSVSDIRDTNNLYRTLYKSMLFIKNIPGGTRT